MRTLVENKSTQFQSKLSQTKTMANDQINTIKKALEEAKRQAYFDMGLSF